MDPENLTPAMRQYVELKKKYSDCVIMFRMGDFYEMFYEDAKIAAKELEITLTSRGKGEKKAPLAGIPHHALDQYLGRFVKKGYKVAICEQLEDPKLAKGLVKRGVVRVVTPGTLVGSGDLDASSNNYLMALFVSGEKVGVSFCDVSTGEFVVYSSKFEDVKEEIVRFGPAECIVPESLMVNQDLIKELRRLGVFVSDYSDRFFGFDYAKGVLLRHFGVLSLDGFGVSDDIEVKVSGGLLNYILETQMNDLLHIKNLKKFVKQDNMFLDAVAVRNLELVEGLVSPKGSLFHVMDKTCTPMGARLLKKWIKSPLLNKAQIEKRFDAVEFLVKGLVPREELKDVLKKVGDIERLVGKVGYGNCNGRDLVALKNSLSFVKEIGFDEGLLGELSKFGDFSEVIEVVSSAVKEDCAVSVRDGGIIKLDYSENLRELYDIKFGGKEFIARLEAQERERSGIRNLRIGFNRVFGYYIDVSKSNLHLVPKEYIRKQTLVNNERFVTEDLKKEEEKILTAEEKIKNLEFELFMEVVERVKGYISVLQNLAVKVSQLDVLLSFALLSVENNYCRPVLVEDGLVIKEGRHPVVELEEDYVPNDSSIAEGEIMIITGPNFAGKSCYMRQVALIVVMAQMGCFVPASSVSMGLVDRVFTRIGASDDLVSGKSTFMVEMEEVANILNNATSKSLVVLDEVGRGTSTYDGVSIAWAVVENIYNKVKCKTMFATHYHVLNSLENDFEGVRNYNIAVKEEKGEIVFLRKLVSGGTDHSFGVYVAKLAGVPEDVVVRAKEIQDSLERKDKFSGRVGGKGLDKQKRLF